MAGWAVPAKATKNRTVGRHLCATLVVQNNAFNTCHDLGGDLCGLGYHRVAFIDIHNSHVTNLDGWQNICHSNLELTKN